MQRLQLTGQKFGRLTVLEPAGIGKNCHSFWLCQCDCGKTVQLRGFHLTHGQIVCSRTCPLIPRPNMKGKGVTHGQSSGANRTPEYKAWLGMKDRCCNPRNKTYSDYGGRGITICNQWLHSFETFFADMGKRPSPKYSLDRIKVNGNYEPSNCRWTTRDIQNSNRRDYHFIEKVWLLEVHFSE